MTGVRLGARPKLLEDALSRAMLAAKESDVAMVAVGYESGWESEGADRPHMHLPRGQTARITLYGVLE